MFDEIVKKEKDENRERRIILLTDMLDMDAT